jgi:hypothetical protein
VRESERRKEEDEEEEEEEEEEEVHFFRQCVCVCARALVRVCGGRGEVRRQRKRGDHTV